MSVCGMSVYVLVPFGIIIGLGLGRPCRPASSPAILVTSGSSTNAGLSVYAMWMFYVCVCWKRLSRPFFVAV